MNERIQELANQAGLFVDLNSKPWPKWMSAEESIVAYNKFAVLIVQECIAKLEEAAEYSPELYGVALDLQEHFDIKVID